MQYDILELNTHSALEIASDLNILTVEDPFTFYANMKWVRPFGMLYTACTIKRFREKFAHIPFFLEYATSREGISYAAHMGFFKAISGKIDIGKEPGEAIGNNNYIPITELDLNQMHREDIISGKNVEMGDTIETKAFELSRILSRDDSEMQILFTYLIREVLRNIPEHSDSSKAWICGQFWGDQTAEIAIIDEGIGVKNSLCKNLIHRKYIETDEDAITCAVKAGISQSFQPKKQNTSNDQWANSGFGLYMASEICKELNGSFCLASGEKYIYISSDRAPQVGDTAFQGTAVKITISTEGLKHSKSIINRISSRGEKQALAIRNAFKKASVPSKGLMETI